MGLHRLGLGWAWRYLGSMPFIDPASIEPFEIGPGCRLRTPYGQNLMLSYVELDAGAVVPIHQHPHEQAGMLLAGRLRFTIGAETRILLPGQMFIIPPNVPHTVEALDGPARVLDVFSPVREDYARRSNTYVKPT